LGKNSSLFAKWAVLFADIKMQNIIKKIFPGLPYFEMLSAVDVF